MPAPSAPEYEKRVLEEARGPAMRGGQRGHCALMPWTPLRAGPLILSVRRLRPLT